MSDVIYFDSCVFLAWLQDEENRADVINTLFEDASKGNLKILTSSLAIAEVLSLQGVKSPIPKEQRDQVKALFANEWIVPKGVNRRLAEISQELVWEYGVSPKDGIHVATAMVYGISTFYSYDRGLTKLGLLTTSFGSVTISEPLPPAQGDLKLDKPNGK